MAKQSASKRYRGLILFIIIFLLILIGVLSASYRASSRIDTTTDILDATGEMSDQSYEILTHLQSLALSPQQPETEELLSNLSESYDSFNNLLSVLDKGGDYDYGDDDIVSIPALTNADEKASIRRTKQIWRKYGGLIKNALAANTEAERLPYVQQAAKYGFSVQGDIYDNLDVIYSNQADISNDTAQQSKLIQLIGIGLIALFFGLFMLYFMRQLQKADKQIFQAQEETSNILKTVNEGLFLLDSNQIIGSQHSKELNNIFGRDNFEGTSFDNLLANVVSRKDLQTAQDYIEQLYNPKVKEKLIQDLNPLDEVQASIVDNSGKLTDRYLQFNFSRVYGDNQKDIDSVLVSIVDNSRAVELEKRLEHEKVHNEQQVEMLVSVLKSDNRTMEQFIETTDTRLNTINNVLRKPELGHDDLMDKVNLIYREIHGLKGEASALGLKKFVQISHDSEEQLQKLKNNTSLSGNDFLPFAVNVEKLMAALDAIKEVNTMLKKRSEEVNTDSVAAPISAAMYKDRFFENAAEAIAEREHKQINFSSYAIQGHLLDGKNHAALKDIATQMIRNAIVHGIETPIERERLGKPRAGEVKMMLMQIDDHHAVLRIYDDGAGINFDKIRQNLVAIGKYTAETVKQLSDNELIKTIFKSGISTADHLSEDAGRGVGLDIVLDRVKALNGKLSVKSEAGKFTRFTITYPI